MLRCNEPATPLISSILYTPHKFGMPDRPDAQENLDTHFHHSSPLTCARDMALLFYFFLESEQAKVNSFIYFLLLCMSLGDGGMGWRAYFLGVKRSCGKRVCLAQCGPFFTYLLTSSYYYYNYSPYGCDDTRVTWLYIFGRGLLGLAGPLCF